MVQKQDIIYRLFSLRGKTALVTGASGGIGRVLALGLAGAGASVGIHGRSQEQLEKTRQLIEGEGGNAVLLPAELASVDACRKLIADSTAALGRLDVLVNCAGINRRRPIEQVTEEDFQTIVDVNLRAIYFLSQAAHPIMRKQGGGKIIHVASLTSSMALATSSVYGVTKAAVAQLAKTQAVEWAPDNIQVNCLAPGFIVTPLTEKSLWADSKRRAWLLGRTPAKRPGRPEDLVGAVLFMAGQGSSFMTGQLISVDGGVLAGGSWDD
jgi:NAD(P)-dependent dehydrogenase (short-subunit alcohol dehydrogenase family)